METLTRMKLPLSQSGGSFGCWIKPIDSQICSATSLFLKRNSMSQTCTQKETLLKSHSSKDVSFVYLESTIKCLSKLHGSDDRILSTSTPLSKQNRIIWSPLFFILNPTLDLHKGVKVLAMASMFRGRFVRNRVAIMCSMTACSFFNLRPGPSLSDSDRELQCLGMAMGRGGAGLKDGIFVPTPHGFFLSHPHPLRSREDLRNPALHRKTLFLVNFPYNYYHFFK